MIQVKATIINAVRIHSILLAGIGVGLPLAISGCSFPMESVLIHTTVSAVDTAIDGHPEQEPEILAYVDAMGGAFCTLGLSPAVSPGDVIVQLDESTVPLQRNVPTTLVGVQAAMITAYLTYLQTATLTDEATKEPTSKTVPPTVTGSRTLCKIVTDVLIDHGKAPNIVGQGRSVAEGSETRSRAATSPKPTGS